MCIQIIAVNLFHVIQFLLNSFYECKLNEYRMEQGIGFRDCQDERIRATYALVSVPVSAHCNWFLDSHVVEANN